MKTTKKSFILGKGYTHFAVNKQTNLIITGWDYKGYDNEELKQFKADYFMSDLINLDVDPSEVKILLRKSIEKMGIDITNTINWQK